MLNQAPCHEDRRGREYTGPCFRNIGTRHMWTASFAPSLEKKPYPLNRLGCGGEKNPLPPPGI
jgi:hypothetical protein